MEKIDLLGKKADYIIAIVLAILLASSMTLAAFTGTWFEALAVGLPAFAVPMALIFMVPGRLASRIGVAIAFMVFVAVFVQQTHGVIEAHFTFFTLVAFLLFYRDWKPILVALVVIAVHHFGFFFLQTANTGIYLFINGPDFLTLVIHSSFAVFESALLIYMAIIFRAEITMQEEAAEILSKIAAGDLTVKVQTKAGDTTNLMVALKKMNDTLESVMVETDTLVKAAAVGYLNTRAGVSKFQGDFRKLVLFDREQASIQVSDSHLDFFIRNMVAILAEMRAALVCLQPSALVEVDLSAI